ncbi:MAG: CRISPR-associated helicase Cas3' [Thermomicrobiales bacterium]
MLFAHSRNDAGVRHDLATHLRDVAALARQYAAPFGGGDFAELAGLLHDIGKANPAFQAYLFANEREPGKKHRTVDHKGAGTLAGLGHHDLLAFPVQGHHGGLPDNGALRSKLKELLAQPRYQELMALLETADAAGLLPPPTADPDTLIPAWALADRATCEFFLRMVFSALVDADCLDTERHFTPTDAAWRGDAPTIAELAATLRAAQEALSGQYDDPVNTVRDEVYRACLTAAPLPPGVFRLTVPTGGGKTRSGLAFALEHALAHGQQRVIVAVPFLTITDQTAQTFRELFPGERAVLEHHSGVKIPENASDAEKKEEENAPGDTAASGELWRRLAAQNWDAPLIVTTTVQLFESLLGRSTTACRKLHNLAHSVIILDEAQTLPPTLLTPILAVLEELTTHYGATVVLCTATQPAFADAPGFRGLRDVREIVPDPARHFRALRRVRYHWPAEGETLDWPEVAARMQAAPQALAILNTKADALALLAALDDPRALHLSTLLCGAHRREVLALVRHRLSTNAPCRLVSTQVVEAGVDIDFPLVLRAMGPLDRIVQAAGRCNREGRLAEGEVLVFNTPDGRVPPGAYRTATDRTIGLLRGGAPDLDDPTIFTAYFASLFDLVNLDARKIQKLRRDFAYEQVAHEFRMIDDDATPVLVRYTGLGPDERAELLTAGHAPIDHKAQLAELLDELAALAYRKGGFGAARGLWRRAQPYLVSLRTRELQAAQQAGVVRELEGGFWLWKGDYDPVCGPIARIPPEDLFI